MSVPFASILGAPTKISVGVRAGALTVISIADSLQGRVAWLCQCDCGKLVVIEGSRIGKRNHSCGCHCQWKLRGFKNYRARTRATPEYWTWQRMISRCENPHRHGYHNYGGRGVSVSPKWRHSFETFLRDVGPKPSPRHTIDRYPNNQGNYEPGNVRWATSFEQSRNERSNRYLECGGRRQILADWATETGMRGSSLWQYIAAGAKRGVGPDQVIASLLQRQSSRDSSREGINQ